MKSLAFLLSLVFLTSCASLMPGDALNTNSQEVSATISINPDFSDERVQLVQFALKNETNDWIDLEGAHIQASDNVTVLVGDRINAWIEACTLEKKVSDYNTTLAFGALAIGGAVVAGSTDHQTTKSTGALIALGGISGMAAQGVMNSKQKTEFVKSLPEKHIFNNVVLPPGKVLHRWILIENPKQEVIVLTMKNSKGAAVQLKMEPRTQI